MTVVKMGKANELVKRAKEKGIEGATVLFGQRIGKSERKSFFFMTIEPEIEMVLMVVPAGILEKCIENLLDMADLNKPEHGFLFVVDVNNLEGVVHDMYDEEYDNEKNGAAREKDYEAIIVIVNRGEHDNVIDSSEKAGAAGGTIICGRGSGIREKGKLLGIPIEPEKDVVLILVKKSIAKKVMDAIVEGSDLNSPGKGIIFTLEVERVAGMG